jgi:hypothetical protein
MFPIREATRAHRAACGRSGSGSSPSIARGVDPDCRRRRVRRSAGSTLEQGLSGGLQLDIEPRRALVYVDGWYVGVVDQFSGYYRHLEIAAGSHTIEILATDYEPLAFDVAISPGRTTTYRGSLQRAEPRD